MLKSLDYIEKNLCEPITRKMIAQHCYVSLSMLEKLFNYALGMGMNTYISKRRLSLAARDLVSSGLSITDLAMKYQYGSLAAFSRDYKRVWQVNPTGFCKNWQFTDILPKINCEEQ